MSGLSTLDLSRYDTPAAPADPEPQEPHVEDFAVFIKRTRGGQEILVCTCEPVPAEVIERAERDHIPLFTPREISLMADIDQESVDVVINAKLAFPGCDIREVIRQAAEVKS